MTVVAAVARQGRVFMAADRETNYARTPVYGAVKIRRLKVRAGQDEPNHGQVLGEVLLAAAGDGAIPVLAARHLRIGGLPDLSDEAACQDWADAIAESLTQLCAEAAPAILIQHQDGSSSMDGAALLGYGGRLWYLFTHQAIAVPDGIAALGTGGDVAIGALHATMRHDADPAVAVCEAVELGCRFAQGCGLDGHPPLLEQLA